MWPAMSRRSGTICCGVSAASGSFSSAGSLHAHLFGLGDEGGSHALAEGAQALADDLEVHRPLGHGTRRDGRPGVRVAGRVEREDVVEGASRGVALGERVAESPASCATWRSVRCGGTPRCSTDPDSTHGDTMIGGDPIAGAVEGEAALAGGRGWVRRRDRSGRDVVVGASRFVPADQQGGVPDVRAVSARWRSGRRRTPAPGTLRPTASRTGCRPRCRPGRRTSGPSPGGSRRGRPACSAR